MSCCREGCAADAAERLYPRSSRHRAKEREVKKRIPGREKETDRKRERGEIGTTPHQGEKVSAGNTKSNERRQALL